MHVMTLFQLYHVSYSIYFDFFVTPSFIYTISIMAYLVNFWLVLTSLVSAFFICFKKNELIKFLQKKTQKKRLHHD